MPSRLAWAALLAITLTALGWRLSALRHDFLHPDEIIATEVVGRIVGERTLDTNWARTGVPEQFRYNQYNFSAYYLFAAALEGLVPGDHGERSTASDRAQLKRLRSYSAVLGAACILLTGWLGFRLWGTLAGLVGAGLALASAPLFQDAIYARPEAFCTALALVLLIVTTGKRAAGTASMLLAGALLGVLIATKVTFALLLPFPLAVLVASRAGPRPAIACIGYFGAVGAGFAVGAPWAVMHPAEYLEGVAYLLGQYSHGHGIHGRPDGSLAERFGYSASYLRYVMGTPLLVAAALGMALVARRRPLPQVIMSAAVLATMLYFLQSHTFFERNLSHALPLVFVLAGVAVAWLGSRIAARRPRLALPLAITLAALLALPAAATTRKLVFIALPGVPAAKERSVETVLARQGRLIADARWEPSVAKGYAGTPCIDTAIRLVDYGDSWFRNDLAELTTTLGLPVLAHVPGPFSDAPVTSTLQTYHAADIWYLGSAPDAQACAWRLGALPAAAGRNGPPVPATVALDGKAAPGAHHPSLPGPDWPAPLYATWAGSDAHTGRIDIDIPGHCGPLLLPLIAGPDTTGLDLQVAVAAADGAWDSLHPRLPAFTLGQWAGLRIEAAAGQCRGYRISAIDAGTGWGQWVGIGMPLPAGP